MWVFAVFPKKKEYNRRQRIRFIILSQFSSFFLPSCKLILIGNGRWASGKQLLLFRNTLEDIGALHRYQVQSPNLPISAASPMQILRSFSIEWIKLPFFLLWRLDAPQVGWQIAIFSIRSECIRILVLFILPIPSIPSYSSYIHGLFQQPRGLGLRWTENCDVFARC